MAQATYDDVNLILRLYDMRREETLRKARAWFSANFKFKTVADMNKACPPGSEMNAWMRQVITYWDMVASFVESGVLDRELFFQSGRELLFVWTRVEPIIREHRDALKDPNYWENLEIVGTAFAAYMNKRSPEAYQSFVSRVRSK